MVVVDISYKQRLETARVCSTSKIGYKVAVKQVNGRQKKHIDWEVVKEHGSKEKNEKYREYIGLTSLDLASIHDEVIFAQVFLQPFFK
jgi:hypothetical protein